MLPNRRNRLQIRHNRLHIALRQMAHVFHHMGHGGAGKDVLGDRVLHEALGRNDLDLAGVDLLLSDDPLHATEVVAVATILTMVKKRNQA